MGRNKFGDRKFIKVADVLNAIKKLNITSFKKSWRDSKSECGMVCNEIGRKNNTENRSRVHFIVNTLNRRKKRKTKERKDQTQETSNAKEMVQRAEDYVETTENTKDVSQTNNTKESKATMSLERNEFRVGSNSDEGEPKEECTTAMVQRAEDYVETTENTKDMSKTNNTKESKATMSLERNEFRVGSDSDEGEPKEECTTEMDQHAEDYVETTENTKDVSQTYNTKESKATMSLERNEFRVGSDSDEGEPKDECTTIPNLSSKSKLTTHTNQVYTTNNQTDDIQDIIVPATNETNMASEIGPIMEPSIALKTYDLQRTNENKVKTNDYKTKKVNVSIKDSTTDEDYPTIDSSAVKKETVDSVNAFEKITKLTERQPAITINEINLDNIQYMHEETIPKLSKKYDNCFQERLMGVMESSTDSDTNETLTNKNLSSHETGFINRKSNGFDKRISHNPKFSNIALNSNDNVQRDAEKPIQKYSTLDRKTKTKDVKVKPLNLDSKSEDNHNLNQGNSFSQSTIESTFGMPVPNEYFEKEVSTTCSFIISDRVWSNLCKGQRNRCFKSGTWEHIISNGIKSINPYCVYMYKWHKVTIAKSKSKTNKFPLFRGEGVCKFTNCNNKCQFLMDDKKVVHCNISSHVNHNITEHHARPIRGKQRQKLRKLFQSGKKPYKHYLEEMKKTPTEVKIAGNFSTFGNTPRTLQEIATESRYTNKLDKNEFESLVKLSHEMTNEIQRKKIHGFIQHISIVPPYVMYWTEDGVRIWHDMAKDSVVYWDATGTVLRSNVEKCTFYYYELACSNPVKGQPVIPVSSMVSSIHSTPIVKFWLGEFRRSEKQIYGHANAVIPYQVTSDRSMVFIQSALSEFNSENLNTFRSRAHRIATGRANEGDLRGTFPHACLAHVMGSFKKIVTQHYKSNFEFGMYLFSILLNSSTLAEVEEILHAIYYVLLSRNVDRKVIKYFEILLDKMSTLDRDADALSELSAESIYTGDHICIQLFEEIQNPDLLTEEDFATRSTKNEFAALGEKILKKVNEELADSKMTALPNNRRFSQTIQEKLHKLFIPTLPLWSNILLGNLSRHGTSDVYTKFIPPANIVRGNSRIEKRFQILKDIELDGKPLDRFDELSVRLKHHTMAVQELAVLKSIKTTRKGRSSRTLQETWDKKKTSNQKNPLLGKYQTCPTQSKLDTFAKTTAILDRPTFQEQKTKSYKLDKETVNNTMNETEDRTTKLFARDAIFSNTSVSLNDNAYLNELYTTKLQDQDNPVFVDEVKASGTGLMNLGNSCWFNSVVQLYNHSKFMRNINEHFNDQISYEENLRSVLEVFDRIGKGIEVSKNHLQLALNDLHTIYGLQSSQQNDAHEFIATGIEHFMGLCEENCFIKVKESYVCTVCGMRQNKDQQVYSDFQLALPSDVIPHEGIKELLDRYFEDEEIDSCCCNDIKRWRNVRITDFPADLSICLLRYDMKNNRSIKIRKPITLNNILNMGKYAELQTDILYTLTGVAIHHGSSPRFGHYTFIKYDRGIPIEINDEAFSVYSGSHHLTDSYIVQYELIPKDDDICHRELPNIIVALMECDGWNYTIDAMQSASGLSVRKKLILELLQQIKIDDITLIHSWKAYKLMQEAIGQIEIFNNTNKQESLINAVLSYMCKNRPILMENNFGLSTVKHTDCAACQNVTTITEHTNCVDIKKVKPLKTCIGEDERETCSVCLEENSLAIQHCIFKYGRTVFIKGSSKILHPDTFSEIITTFTPRAVMSSLFTVLFRQKGRDVEIVQLQSPNSVAEVNMENVIYMADQCLHGVLLIADQHDVKECTKQMYQILYDSTYIEPDRTLSVQLTDDDLKLMDGLSTPMRVRGFQLRKEEVVRFLSGEFSDLNIDAFFSTLNVDNSLTIPSSWFGANIGYEKTNKKEGRETWFDKDLIFLPININRNHWLLTVIFPKGGLIYHLDPLGNPPTEDIANRLCSFLNDRKLVETFDSIEQVWKIDDLMATGKFPLQISGDSCGAMVCIYGKMIEQNAVLPKGKTDKHIRQYVFHEVIEAYRTEALNNTKFGLQNVMFTPDIDTIVQTIVKGEQTFNTEHHRFLKSPNALHREKMCNFGGEYISQDDYFEIAGFLLDKYFWCKKGLFSLNCQQCIFAEADELNRKLKENFQYAPWYVDCVLVKGVLVEILRRSLNSAAEEMWILCKMTEFSVSQAIKNDIKQLRDAKRKEKEDRYQ